MKYNEKKNALILRKGGFSIKEISERLHVAKSSVSVWVRDVRLSSRAQRRLLARITTGQWKSAEKKKKQTERLNNALRLEAQVFVDRSNISNASERILCSLIYWCEGVKEYKNGIAFTNSDPKLTSMFVKLLVKHFDAVPSKFHCQLHLHEYHNESSQKKYWASAIGIPMNQFNKPYWKPHTGYRKREGYPGCISVRYYDNILARKVMYVAQASMNRRGV